MSRQPSSSLLWAIAKRTARGFVNDDALSLGGALAFYTALSMAPLLVLLVALAGFFWQESEVRLQIIRQVYLVAGQSAADMATAMMKQAGEKGGHKAATVIGFATLLFSATGAFAQLQFSMNRVWNVEGKPGRDIADFLRRRLVSLVMILAMAVLLIGSLVASTAIHFIASRASFHLPGGDTTWSILNYGGSLVIFAGIFTLLHHVLPDVVMPWKDSLLGGAITSVLFVAGKELLGFYLGAMGFASAYGAASSFFVVLLWVYVSSLGLFFGAELTQAFATEMGHDIVPKRHARAVH